MNKPSIIRIILRGLIRRCLQCGIGHPFAGYLTLGEECPHCHESFQGIRTDDAAPWAIIFVVGHLLVPFVMLAIEYDLPTIPFTALMSVLGIVFALAVLPVMKGVFVGLNWRFNIRDGKAR
ncbi:MAG: DUF983 domain-containing protein [Rhodospirillales bacterium]